ncbi:MAG: COG4705 family protein [Pyrinomonadaceae bacterium]
MNISKSETTAFAGEMLNKVPQITLFFWIIKVLCTTVGETASDFLNVNLNFGLTGTSVVMGILLLITLVVQIRTRKYIPVIYWLTVVLISIFGTLVTDIMTDNLGVPLEFSTIFFSVLLAITFAVWYAKEKTLSIHSIFTTQREIFYWTAILFTFALGTASGDLMAEGLGLGYFTTGVIVCGVIAVFAIAWKLGLNSILAFWLIYIMTRPLGASLGDYLSQTQAHGGLGLGATITSVIFISAIIITVVFLIITKWDVIDDPEIVEESDETGRHGLLQTAAVVTLLVAVSVGGYYWRQSVLQTSLPDQAANPTSSTNSNSPTTAAKTPTSPLGDLSSSRKTTQDTLDFVNKNDLAGAKNRVGDLEYEWDNAQARLRPMNGAKWTEIDNAIDKVLREVRAVNPNSQSSKSALEALLGVLK